MIVNGKKIAPDGTAIKTLGAYLESAGYDLGRIAVEKNGVIVPKSDFGDEALSDDDVIEIVCFVGGG